MKKLLLSIVCGAFMLGEAVAALPEPLIWWTMDEVTQDGKIIDASGNGHDLTLGPGMSLVESRLSGKALAYEWQVLADDAAGAAFSAPTAAATQVTVSSTGVYAFRVKVTDGDLTVYSEPQTFTVVSAGTAILLR